MIDRSPRRGEELALLVHPSVAALSSLQHRLSERGVRCVVARDLPTALLALNQHSFTLVLLNANISEEGDGWALGGVMRLLFPYAFIGVLAPETSVLTLQAAINHGLNRVYDSAEDPHSLIDAFLKDRQGETDGASVH